MSLGFTGERIVPGAPDCEPTFAQKMYQEHVARYAFAARLAQGADVLDVGCGVGYGSRWLAGAGARSVFGFDVSEGAIEHARMHYYHPAVSFAVQDATAIQPGQGYDLVTCFELIEHIHQQEQVLDRIKAALRPDGTLVISTPRPLDAIRTHFHVHELSFEALHALLAQRFRHVRPFFEMNCFTSLIAEETPTHIGELVSVTGRTNIDHADYFLFVASDAPIEASRLAEPLLTLNDDAYILTLEKDVAVLRNAENDHLARIAALESEKAALLQAQADAEARARNLDALRAETGAIRAAIEAAVHQIGARSDEGDLARIAALEAELVVSRADLANTQASMQASLAALSDQVRIAEQQRDTAVQDAAAQVRSVEEDLAATRDDRDALAETLRAEQAAAAEALDLARSHAETLAVEHAEALDLARAHAETLAVEHAEALDLARAQAEALEAELADAVAAQDAARLQVTAMHTVLDAQREAGEQQLYRVRKAMADLSERLAQAQTDTFAVRANAERLPEALGRVSQLENELNALRYRFEETEATLMRFRRSFSWSVTRPLRWCWRTWRKFTGRRVP